MTVLESEIQINAPQEKVWSILANFGAVQEFAPAVAKSYYTSKHREGVGITRHCHLKPMGEVDEEVFEWDEGKGMTIRILRGKMMPPLASNSFRYDLRTENNMTVTHYRFEYKLKFGILGALLNLFLVQPQMKKTLRGMMEGLKQSSETSPTNMSHNASYST